jgi:hypothetical protein
LNFLRGPESAEIESFCVGMADEVAELTAFFDGSAAAVRLYHVNLVGGCCVNVTVDYS